jgi:electron transfer flavoprotein alpha/beta subunit
MYAVEMSFTPNRKRIRVKREVESGHEVLEARLPALVSASKGEALRRMPRWWTLQPERARKITAATLDPPSPSWGLPGPTQVVKSSRLSRKRAGRKPEGLDVPSCR